MGVYEYYRLQPKHHFENPPLLSKDTAKATKNPVKYNQQVVSAAPETFNVLLIGSDERTEDGAGHSDSIIIVHVNLKNNSYNMLSIPRDTRVYMDGYGYTKLTSVMYIDQADHGLQKGIQAAIDAISGLTGLPINYYAITNYWGLQDIVDTVGGINMKIPFPVTLTHAWYPQDQGKQFNPGTYAMDGQMVTEVVHERYSLANGDYGRQQLQEEALIGIARKVMKPTSMTKLPAVIRALPKFLIGTNMNTSDMLSLALEAKHFSSSKIHYYQVSGKQQAMYNDVLKADDDEVVLDMQQLDNIIDRYFQ
ncbi:LCP family protein [Alicyclobacillus fodiniaquatilis]|uniref:LCP family protein n=1 Tax=Alicyclobacillus fodiniaquatilis TaxID=1661150 RepID=A0ABW4JF48_9BACL